MSISLILVAKQKCMSFHTNCYFNYLFPRIWISKYTYLHNYKSVFSSTVKVIRRSSMLECFRKSTHVTNLIETWWNIVLGNDLIRSIKNFVYFVNNTWISLNYLCVVNDRVSLIGWSDKFSYSIKSQINHWLGNNRNYSTVIADLFRE